MSFLNLMRGRLLRPAPTLQGDKMSAEFTALKDAVTKLITLVNTVVASLETKIAAQGQQITALQAQIAALGTPDPAPADITAVTDQVNTAISALPAAS